MISIAMLEDNDVIQADDFVRQLSLIYTGQSDYLATNATYGGSPMNRLGWIPAKYMCPAWVNKTVGEFNQAMMGRDRHATEKSVYEFIRGAVPKDHCEKLTREELKIANMIWS
jgi:hypothetical protein